MWMVGGSVLLTKGFVTDKTFSSLPYSGVLAGADIEFSYKGERLSHLFAVSYVNGVYKAAREDSYQAKNKYANFDYTLLAQLTSANAPRWYLGAGGGINILYTDRTYNKFMNSNTAFEFASSLSASVLSKYYIGETANGFFIYDQLQSPMATYLVQSPFGYNNLVASGKSAFYSKDFVSFSSFLRLKNRFGIVKELGDHQQFSLTYLWDYYHLQNAREVKSAVHSIAITYSHTL